MCPREQHSKPIRSKPPDHRTTTKTPISHDRKFGCVRDTASKADRTDPANHPPDDRNADHSRSRVQAIHRTTRQTEIRECPETQRCFNPRPVGKPTDDRRQHPPSRPIRPTPESRRSTSTDPDHRERNRTDDLTGAQRRHQANLPKHPKRPEPGDVADDHHRTNGSRTRPPPRSTRRPPQAPHRATTRRRTVAPARPRAPISSCREHGPRHASSPDRRRRPPGKPNQAKPTPRPQHQHSPPSTRPPSPPSRHQSPGQRTRHQHRRQPRRRSTPATSAEAERHGARHNAGAESSTPPRQRGITKPAISSSIIVVNPGRPSPPGCEAPRRNHPAPSTTWR